MLMVGMVISGRRELVAGIVSENSVLCSKAKSAKRGLTPFDPPVKVEELAAGLFWDV